MKPLTYCRKEAAPIGSSRYYSLHGLMPDEYRALLAIYAFAHAISKIPFACSETHIARGKLQWWHNEIHKLYNSVPAHPIGQALVPSVQRYGLSYALFNEYIDAIETSLQFEVMASFNDFEHYCHRTTGVIDHLVAQTHTDSDNKSLEFCHQMALCTELINCIRFLYKHTQHNRVYFPQADLKQFDLTPQQILAAKMTPQLRELLRFEAAKARDYHAQALRTLGKERHYAYRSYVIYSALQLRLLDEIERDNFDVLSHLTGIPPVRKLWLSWRLRKQLLADSKPYLKPE